MSSLALKAGLAGLAIVGASAFAFAQMGPPPAGMHGPMMGQGDQNQHQQMMDRMHGQNGMQGGMHGQNEMHGHHGGMGPHANMMDHHSGAQPTMAGQDAFGTIQEVVRILEADPSTDWSKVNIAALREHLIDMNEVTLHATATEKALDDGVEITVTGVGRTRDAIKRMVPAHVHELAKPAGPPAPKMCQTGSSSWSPARTPSRSSNSRRWASWASWCRARIISLTIS